MDLERRLVSAISRRSFLAGAAFSLPAAYSLALQGCVGASEDESGAGVRGPPLSNLPCRVVSPSGPECRGVGQPGLPGRWPRTEYGIDGVEYVNSFFKDRADDTAYLTDLKSRCDRPWGGECPHHV